MAAFFLIGMEDWREEGKDFPILFSYVNINCRKLAMKVCRGYIKGNKFNLFYIQICEYQIKELLLCGFRVEFQICTISFYELN